MAGTKTNLTVDAKNQIAQFLLVNSKDGTVHHGKAKEASQLFGVTRRTIHYIWKAARTQISEGMPIHFTSGRKGVPKRKRVHIDVDLMKTIAFEKRSTIRRLAKELQVSKSVVGRWIKEGLIKAHTNAIKPELTPKNKLQRVNFSLNALMYDVDANKIMFGDMHNVVHIDEKWFFMTRVCERYYLLPGEEQPHRTCKSKRFIPKVMFMCAVSRPILASDGQVLFDGKIGIFPFTEVEPAKRNSKNRVKGTMVTKPIDSINKNVIRECIVNQIIPAIKAKWPSNMSKNVIIQQDNAKPHITDSDPEFRAAASSDGFNIRLVCQPPNSPDTNVNDLGWFRAIQSLQVDTASYNVDDLIKNVMISYDNLSSTTLNNVFLSLQCCLIEILKVNGGNNYDVPHIGKARLIRENALPINLDVDEELVRGCISKLIEDGYNYDHVYDISQLQNSLLG